MDQTLAQGIPTTNQTVQVPAGFVNQEPLKETSSKSDDTVILTPQQVEQLMAQLQPQVMSNPVKIVQPSYLVTEEQMKYLLSLASGHPQQVDFMNKPSNTPMSKVQKQPNPTAVCLFDGVANATLGTMGRVGHTLTGLVDNVIDIFTLGYSAK